MGNGDGEGEDALGDDEDLLEEGEGEEALKGGEGEDAGDKRKLSEISDGEGENCTNKLPIKN